MKSFVLAVAATLLAGAAHAASFHIGTHDAKATGMATAVTADVDDPSGILYNPAGIAQGEGLELRVGDTLFIPQFSADIGGISSTTEANPVPPPHLYASWGITEDATVGVGFFMPFGLELTWPEGWPGREIATETSLRNYVINPVAAYRFLDRVRIAVGLQVVRATVRLERRVDFVLSEGTLELEGADWGVGVNGGVQVRVLDKSLGVGELTVGAAWRGEVSLSFDEGDAFFRDVPPPLAGRFRDQRVSTGVTLPQILALGIAWRLDRLRLGVDTEYTGWQTVRSLELRFEDPTLDSAIIKNLRHTWNLHVGAEYEVVDGWFARLGVLWDPSPNPKETLSPELPDADRLNFTGGVGLKMGGFRADAAYQLVTLREWQSTLAEFPAKYGGYAHVVGLTVGFRL